MRVQARQFLWGVGLALVLGVLPLAGYAEDSASDPPGFSIAPASQSSDVSKEKAGEQAAADRAAIKKRFEEARVSLEAVDAGVREVLMDLAKQADIPIVVSPEVSGKITLRLKEMPFKDVFQTVLKLAKCTYETKNGIYMVIPRPDLVIAMVRKRPAYMPPTVSIYREPAYVPPAYPWVPSCDFRLHESRIWIDGRWVPQSNVWPGGFGGVYYSSVQYILGQPTVPYADKTILIDKVVVPRK